MENKLSYSLVFSIELYLPSLTLIELGFSPEAPAFLHPRKEIASSLILTTTKMAVGVLR